jgi:hypothetical protein
LRLCTVKIVLWLHISWPHPPESENIQYTS